MNYHKVYEKLMDEHYRTSIYTGVLPDATHTSQALNPSCGDEVILQWQVHEGVIIRMRFQGTGCVLSHIAASVLAQQSEQKKVTEFSGYTAVQLATLLGIELGPNRMQCVALPVQALAQLVAAVLLPTQPSAREE